MLLMYLLWFYELWINDKGNANHLDAFFLCFMRAKTFHKSDKVV